MDVASFTVETPKVPASATQGEGRGGEEGEATRKGLAQYFFWPNGREEDPGDVRGAP